MSWLNPIYVVLSTRIFRDELDRGVVDTGVEDDTRGTEWVEVGTTEGTVRDLHGPYEGRVSKL